MDSIDYLLKAHRENFEECRWCFAIDLQRVNAKQIAQYNFPDATVFVFRCDRCGGEFSYYSHGWGQDYIEERTTKLYPELKGKITENIVWEINDRLCVGI